MTRYSARFLRWASYFAASVVGAIESEEGLSQFHAFESRAKSPAIPDPYFVRLCRGRSMFNALQKEVRESYLTSDWQGWLADAMTMPDWLFLAFYGWHPEFHGVTENDLATKLAPYRDQSVATPISGDASE